MRTYSDWVTLIHIGPADALTKADELARLGRLSGHVGRLATFPQSACLRRKAGISISSMPLEARASTLAAACVRPERQTLGIWLAL